MENIDFEGELAAKLRPLIMQWQDKGWLFYVAYLQTLAVTRGDAEARQVVVENYGKRCWPGVWIGFKPAMGWPPLITADDFADAVAEYVLDHHEIADELLNVDCLISLIVQRAKNANPHQIDLANVGAQGEDLDASLPRDIVEYSVFGESVKIGIVSEDEDSCPVIRLQISGFGSAAAHKELADELAHHALSILMTFELIYMLDRDGVELDEFANCLAMPFDRADLTGTIDTTIGDWLALPLPLVLRHFKWLFELFISQRTSNKQVKDPLARRIATSCLFLCEADQATAAPMRAAATFAAIEALVGRKNDQTEHIARRAMTLVEPRRENRHGLKRAFKRLYDTRCEIVHGNSFNAEQDVIVRARLLAAVLLFAVLERYDMARKSDEQLNYDQYLNEVDEAADTGREIPPGIAPDSRRLAFHDTLCRLLEH